MRDKKLKFCPQSFIGDMAERMKLPRNSCMIQVVNEFMKMHGKEDIVSKREARDFLDRLYNSRPKGGYYDN